MQINIKDLIVYFAAIIAGQYSQNKSLKKIIIYSGMSYGLNNIFINIFINI
jgi:hypothetical protein